MKIKEFEQAERLYFTTNLTKTEIAETLGINRRTLHNWIHQNEWDRLKNNAQHMPAYLAENCHFILANLMKHHLSEARIGRPITPAEVQAIQRLQSTANRLKAGHTISETMQLTNQLLDFVCLHNPAMADELSPLLKKFVQVRAKGNIYTYKPAHIGDSGFIPHKDEDPTEIQRDIAEFMAELDAQNNPPGPDTGESSMPTTHPHHPQPPTPSAQAASSHPISSTHTPPITNHIVTTTPSCSQTPQPLQAPTILTQNNKLPKNQYPHLNRAQRRKLAQKAA